MLKLFSLLLIALPMSAMATKPLPDANPISRTRAEIFDCHIVVTKYVHKFGSPLTEGEVARRTFLNKGRHGPFSLQINRDRDQFYITVANFDESVEGLVAVVSSHESALAMVEEKSKKMYIDPGCP